MGQETYLQTLFKRQTLEGEEKGVEFNKAKWHYFRSGLICTGVVHYRDWSEDGAYLHTELDKFKEVDLGPELIDSVVESRQVKAQPVTAGPSCFGDEGGPLFRVHRKRAVLVGIFSFVPWGKCVGREDLGFFTGVKEHMAWIRQYVAWDETFVMDEGGSLS